MVNYCAIRSTLQPIIEKTILYQDTLWRNARNTLKEKAIMACVGQRSADKLVRRARGGGQRRLPRAVQQHRRIAEPARPLGQQRRAELQAQAGRDNRGRPGDLLIFLSDLPDESR
jgi:hypothetical protein